MHIVKLYLTDEIWHNKEMLVQHVLDELSRFIPNIFKKTNNRKDTHNKIANMNNSINKIIDDKIHKPILLKLLAKKEKNIHYFYVDDECHCDIYYEPLRDVDHIVANLKRQLED